MNADGAGTEKLHAEAAAESPVMTALKHRRKSVPPAGFQNFKNTPALPKIARINSRPAFSFSMGSFSFRNLL
jgi:hypothetical protein